MKKTAWILMTGLMCVAMVSCFLAGCESTDEASGLRITPSSVDLREVNDKLVVLEVGGTSNTVSGLRELSLPLEWSVSNPSLGSITASAGTQATYARTSARGANVVSVRDQYGSEGFVTIQQ